MEMKIDQNGEKDDLMQTTDLKVDPKKEEDDEKSFLNLNDVDDAHDEYLLDHDNNDKGKQEGTEEDANTISLKVRGEGIQKMKDAMKEKQFLTTKSEKMKEGVIASEEGQELFEDAENNNVMTHILLQQENIPSNIEQNEAPSSEKKTKDDVGGESYYVGQNLVDSLHPDDKMEIDEDKKNISKVETEKDKEGPYTLNSSDLTKKQSNSGYREQNNSQTKENDEFLEELKRIENEVDEEVRRHFGIQNVDFPVKSENMDLSFFNLYQSQLEKQERLGERNNQVSSDNRQGKEDQEKVQNEEDDIVNPEDWRCVRCFQLERDSNDIIVMCEVYGCGRAFHLACADLVELPPEDKPWYCDACVMKNLQKQVIVLQEEAKTNQEEMLLMGKEINYLRKTLNNKEQVISN